MKTFISRWLPVLLWAFVIFLASSNPDPYKPLPAGWLKPCFSADAGKPSCAEYLGRVLHLGEYTVLAVLTARGVIWKQKMGLGLLGLTLGLCSLFALSDETHQLFVPGRSFQLLDLAIDLIGICLGLLIYSMIRKKVVSHASQPMAK